MRCTAPIIRRTWDFRITPRNVSVFDVIGPHLCCKLPKHIGYKTGFSYERREKSVGLPPKASGITGVGHERGLHIYFFYCILYVGFGKTTGDTNTILYKRAWCNRISRWERRIIGNRYFNTTIKNQMLLVSLCKWIDQRVLLHRFIDLHVPHVNKSNFFLILNSIDGLTLIKCFVWIKRCVENLHF